MIGTATGTGRLVRPSINLLDIMIILGKTWLGRI